MTNQPARINLVEVRTVWGYKNFELYQGDITDLDDGADILVVSAFEQSYAPLRGTVLGALYHKGIDVQKLARRPLINLRRPLQCWVSKQLSGAPFKHIICVETPFDVWPERQSITGNIAISQALSNLFAVLSLVEAKGLPSRSLAMPMLGTGYQDYNPQSVIKTMLDLSTDHLLRSASMSTIKFVAYGHDRAIELRDAMDTILGRVQVKLPKGNQVDVLKRDISEQIKALRSASNHKVLDHLQRLVLEVEVTPLGFGITGRDLADCLVDDLLQPEDRTGYLNARIRKLQKPKYFVPEWLKEYMHVLRTIGNEFAHGQASGHSAITTLRPDDLEIQLMCIRRLLRFWSDYRREQPNQVLQ